MPTGIKITQYTEATNFGNPMNGKADISHIPPGGTGYETRAVKLADLREFWKAMSSESTPETVGNFERTKKVVTVFGHLNDAGTDYILEPSHTTESTRETRFAYDLTIIDRVVAHETRLCVFDKYPTGKPIKRVVITYGATTTFVTTFIPTFTIA